MEYLRRIKSPVFFAHFLRFKVKTKTRDLSTAGSEVADCELKSQRGLKDNGVAEMFFLLRMAFWLGLVLVLLPRDKAPGTEKTPQIDATQAVSAATAAVSDVSQFCKRQPAACEVGGKAATMIGERAQDGARKLYQIITDKRASDHTGAIGGMPEPLPNGAAPVDTLTPNDLEAEWSLTPPPTTSAN
jgi:hypothetical protein